MMKSKESVGYCGGGWVASRPGWGHGEVVFSIMYIKTTHVRACTAMQFHKLNSCCFPKLVSLLFI